jgi:glutathione S-transferase
MLTLYMHPLASYCWKVLLPLYETATPFTAKHIDLADAAQKAELLRVSPFTQFPVLLDGDKVVAESSIIIEYLGLVPTSLEARARDRFFDVHVMDPMGRIVREKLRSTDPTAVLADKHALATAYRVIEDFIGDFDFACGATLTIADCAAVPSLFYADYIVPIEDPKTRAYLERMLARPSMQRIRAEAAPYWPNFPFATARSGVRGAT